MPEPTYGYYQQMTQPITYLLPQQAVVPVIGYGQQSYGYGVDQSITKVATQVHLRSQQSEVINRVIEQSEVRDQVAQQYQATPFVPTVIVPPFNYQYALTPPPALPLAASHRPIFGRQAVVRVGKGQGVAVQVNNRGQQVAAVPARGFYRPSPQPAEIVTGQTVAVNQPASSVRVTTGHSSGLADLTILLIVAIIAATAIMLGSIASSGLRPALGGTIKQVARLVRLGVLHVWGEIYFWTIDDLPDYVDQAP